MGHWVTVVPQSKGRTIFSLLYFKAPSNLAPLPNHQTENNQCLKAVKQPKSVYAAKISSVQLLLEGFAPLAEVESKGGTHLTCRG